MTVLTKQEIVHCWRLVCLLGLGASINWYGESNEETLKTSGNLRALGLGFVV